MTSRPRPNLDATIRALAVAIVVSFSLSAVSIAYAAGRHAAVDRSGNAPFLAVQVPDRSSEAVG